MTKTTVVALLVGLSALSGTAHAGGIPYQGGPIIKNARVRLVFLGDEWADPSAPYVPVDHDRLLDTTTDFANRRQFYDPLREYCGSNGCVDTGHFDSAVTLPHTFGTSGTVGGHCSGLNPCVTHADVLKVLSADAKTLSLDANLVYVVLLPARQGFDGKGVTWDDGDNAAGAHFDDLYVNGVQIPYGVVSSLTGATIAHELSEMITDPFPGSKPAYHAYVVNQTEIGDVCANVPATLDGIATQAMWSNKASACIGYAAWPELPGAVHATDGDPSSSFVVFDRGYGAGGPDLYAIAPDNGMRYKAYDNGNWTPYVTPRDPTWVSRIAATSSSRINDLIGIGGGAQALWWRAAENPFDFGWAQAGDFPAATVTLVPGGNGRSTAVAIGQDGKVRYQYLDIAGNPPSIGGWTTLPGMSNATVMAAINVGGFVYVVASANGSWPLYLTHDFAQFNPRTGKVVGRAWTNWVPVTTNQQPLPLPNVGQFPMVKQIVLGQAFSGGRLTIFAATNQGVLRTVDTRTSSWPWKSTSLPLSSSQLAVASNGDGRLELFGLDEYGHVWHTWQSSLDDDDWAGPASRGGHLSTLEAVTHPEGLIEIFGVDPDTQQIAHNAQNFNLPGYWVY